MRCQRCNAVMVHERYYGPGDPFWGWRCMLCGNISDPMILENRSQCATLAAKGKKEGGKLKYRSTGRIFEVKKRTDQFVTLKSLDGVTQILPEEKNIFDFFEKTLNASSRTSEMDK